MTARRPNNSQIADHLERIAVLLDAKKESPFRVRSYRNAAASIRETKGPLSKMVKTRGADALREVEGVGEKLAGLIMEYLDAGETELLKKLEKEVPAGKVKAPLPNSFEKPITLPVGLILEMDEEYRRKAAADKLRKIAPRLINPERKAWLPIMATEKEGFKFTVMFSNTQRAHDLKKTNDWVVVYYRKGEGENQCTVVTESRGPLKGKRIIRGREKECARHYAKE
jgi:hypothetical protein